MFVGLVVFDEVVVLGWVFYCFFGLADGMLRVFLNTYQFNENIQYVIPAGIAGIQKPGMAKLRSHSCGILRNAVRDALRCDFESLPRRFI
jgi:hypothetical protein